MTQTSPDTRLLLPAPAVQIVPVGAPMAALCDTTSDDGWVIRAGTPGTCVGHFNDAILVAFSFDEPDVRGVHVLPMRPEDIAIDLSEPLEGARVDVLSWALKQLNPDAVTCSVSGPPGVWQVTLHDSDGSAIAEYAEPRALAEWGCTILDSWPDLDGLEGAEAARAAVVAAITAGGLPG